MQHIYFYAFITYIYLVSIDQLIIIIYTIFKLWESWGSLQKLNYFLMTSFPVRMRLPRSDFQRKSRSWVDLSVKKIFGWIGPTSCLLNLLIDTLLFRFQPLKNPHFKKKSTNQTSFPTKSTTLNPMVKSDLVTSGDGTIRFLFFSVAIINIGPTTDNECSSSYGNCSVTFPSLL